MSITFLIPIYNEVKTARKAIEETLKIDLQNKEIVIVDNNSTDGSKKNYRRIQKYSKFKNNLSE